VEAAIRVDPFLLLGLLFRELGVLTGELTVGHVIFPSTAGGGGLALLVPHIFGSIVAGMIAGAVLAAYATRVGTGSGIFTFAVLFIAAEAGAALHLNPLLVGLAAGLAARESDRSRWRAFEPRRGGGDHAHVRDFLRGGRRGSAAGRISAHRADRARCRARG
jgi:hypothetical protein